MSTIIAVQLLTACGGGQPAASTAASASAAPPAMTEEEEVFELRNVAPPAEAVTDMDRVDMTKWNFNRSDNVFWQTGIPYCGKSSGEGINTLSIYVPGKYFDRQENEDGTYMCAPDYFEDIEGFSADTAPIILLLSDGGGAAVSGEKEYGEGVQLGRIRDYTRKGCVVIVPGFRGQDENNGIAAAADLKAAIRYLRYNEGMLAGSLSEIYAAGTGRAADTAAVLGASGNCELYDDVFEEIGAVGGLDDSITGAFCADAPMLFEDGSTADPFAFVDEDGVHHGGAVPADYWYFLTSGEDDVPVSSIKVLAAAVDDFGPATIVKTEWDGEEEGMESEGGPGAAGGPGADDGESDDAVSGPGAAIQGPGANLNGPGKKKNGPEKQGPGSQMPGEEETEAEEEEPEEEEEGISSGKLIRWARDCAGL